MITVIGGGPCGYVAAIKAAKMGAKVRLIERGTLGGVCTNWGCIPTKTYVHIAEEYKAMQEAKQIGLNADNITFNWDKIKGSKKKIVARLQRGIQFLLKKNKVEYIEGEAVFKSPKVISVTKMAGDTIELETDSTLIATGSVPKFPPIEGIDTEGLWTSKEALDAPEIPDSLLIIGGGVIGVEMAHIFALFGTEVTIVEILPEILPGVPKDLTDILQKNLKKEKITIKSAAQVQKIAKAGAGFQVTIGDAQLDFANVLLSTGRTGKDRVNAAAIGLEFDDSGFIRVDEYLQTSIDNIYAAGDIVGEPLLAHKASYEGEIAVMNALGKAEANIAATKIPAAIFSALEIGTIGITEEQAELQGINYAVGKFPYVASGKALADNATEGFIKTIIDEDTKKVVGMTFIGLDAATLLGIGSVIVSQELNIDNIERTIFAHPTLPEMIKESILESTNNAIHV